MTLSPNHRRACRVVASMLLAAVAAAPPALAAAQIAKRGMTFDDVMSLHALGSVQIAPDGRSVVYTVSAWAHPSPGSGGTPVRRTHLWLVPTAGGTPRQLTFGDRGEGDPAWSPDGRTIAFVAARGSGRAGAEPQIWLLPMDGGEARQLTQARDGVAGFAWSPDGTRIAYLSVDSLSGAETAKRQRHDDAQVFESGFRFTHLWVVDVATGRTSEVAHGDFTLSALAISSVPHWSPDGTRIAFVESPTTLLRDLRGSVHVVTVATRRVETIAPEYRSAAGALTEPVWSPDGRTLAFTTFPQSSTLQGDSMPEPLLGNGQLVLYDVATRRVRTINAPASGPVLTQLQWTPDGRSLLFTSSDRVYQDVFRYDVASSRFGAVTHGMVVHGISLSKDGARVAFGVETAVSPTDLYVSGAAFTSPRKLTTINPQIANIALGQTDVIAWRSSDGTPVEGILLKPVGFRTGERYPLLVEEHGGPTDVSINGFQATPTSPGQVWAGRGWAVLYPNPRGSEGYGEPFMVANIKDLGGGDFRDIMAGVDDVIRLGVADSTRMAFEGWSYGGYMTAWVVGHTARFKAARMGAGMSDLVSMYGTTEIPGYNGLLEGGPPSARTLALYQRQSPITYADRVATPLLILHGASDPRVPTGQSLEFFRALRDRGKTVELVLYPREKHGFVEYYHLLDRMRRGYAWITRYTLGTGAPQGLSR